MSIEDMLDRYVEAITVEGYGYLAALAANIDRPRRELTVPLPVERVAYSHVAGGHEGAEFYHDTHSSDRWWSRLLPFSTEGS